MTFPVVTGLSTNSLCTIAETASAIDATNGTTYTFSSQALGTAGHRHIIIGVVGANQTGARTVESVTVAGISATQVASQQGSGGAFFGTSAIWIAAVPTGTSGDVVVTWSTGGQNHCAITLWGVYNLRRSVANATANSTSSTVSFSLPYPGGGVAVGIRWLLDNAAARTDTWTGLTENEDTTIEGGSTYSSASGATPTLGAGTTSVAITVTPNDPLDATASSFASFR